MMSFFNFGPSPTKSSDAFNSGDANGDFNMFGGGSEEGTASFFGSGTGEPVDSSAGSFFSGGPSAGGSMFGPDDSSGSRQQEGNNSGHKNVHEDFSQMPPAKKIKPGPSQSQPLSSIVPSNLTIMPCKAQPLSNTSSTAHPGPSPSTTPSAPPHATKTDGPSPTVKAATPLTKPGASSHQEAVSENCHQGRPDYQQAPSSLNQTPPVQRNYTDSQNFYKTQAQGNSQAILDSSTDRSDLRKGKTVDDLNNIEDDEMPADVLLRDMIDMQKQKLCHLIPQMKKGEEFSDQILNSARLVLGGVTNYGEKLAVTKQLYCSRLSQVSSYLRMVPKTEK